MIAAPDDKVDLRPFEPWVVRDESPTRLLRRDPADTELPLDLAGMEQTDEFKCQAENGLRQDILSTFQALWLFQQSWQFS